MRGQPVEFADVVREYLGEKAYYIAVVVSMVTLIGALIVYWVLMSGFLYDIVDYVHDHGARTIPALNSSGIFNGSGSPDHTGAWERCWTPKTAPLFLIALLFPLLNLKKIDFFTKFNTLGVVSIMYMLFFVLFTTFYGENFDDRGGSPFGGLHLPDPKVKCADTTGTSNGVDGTLGRPGLELRNQSTGGNLTTTGCNVEWVSPHVFSLTGVLMLSYFIHNGSLSIMRNNRRENNARDLWLAFALVMLTYAIVSICFYVSFQGDKTKIQQNFLSNFDRTDGNYIFALTAKCFLLVQMITVFPLLMFIVRFQAFSTFCNGNPWPSLGHVLGLNGAAVACAVLVAVYYPNIGDILRYTGAVCGAIYVFALPVLVRREANKRAGTYTWLTDIPTYFLIAFAVVNVAMQFVKMPGS